MADLASMPFTTKRASILCIALVSCIPACDRQAADQTSHNSTPRETSAKSGAAAATDAEKQIIPGSTSAPVAAQEQPGTGDAMEDRIEAAHKAGLAAADQGGAAAAAMASQYKTTPELESFLSALVPKWMVEFPAECVDFLAKLPPSGVKMRWLGESLVSYAGSEPKKAAERLTILLPEPAQDPILFARVASAWAAKDPQAAIAWAGSLSEADLSGPIFGMALTTWAEKDPAAVLTYLQNTQGLEDFVIDSGMRVAALALAKADGPAAARWAFQQEASGGRSEPVAMTFSTWARESPADAAQFAIKETPSEHRAAATLAVARGWAEIDPQSALDWAKSLPENSPGAKESVESALLAMRQAASESR